MICTVLLAFLASLPTPQEALDSMLDGNPFPSSQESVLIEYGDSFLLPQSPDLAKYAILRQFHRMVFQLQQEPVDQLVDFMNENWDDLDTETRNLWREFAGRTGLAVSSDLVEAVNLTSILRYCSESGNPVPSISQHELT
ncbi:MAG: hypothetical protein GY852_02385, partial [bacterium]|nr:hypothetical protein [bacterium]